MSTPTTELPESAEKELLIKMDKVAREFVAATGNQLGAELISVTKNVCQPQKEINKANGQAGLDKLVEEVRGLAARMPEICEQCFYRDSVWLHLNWNNEHKYKQDTRKSFPWAPGERGTNQTFGWSFIDAIDHLGAILAQFGYSTNKGGGYEGYPVAHSSLYRQFTWSPEMERLHKKYKALESELWKTHREKEKATADLPFKPTQDFWDSVR